MIVWRVWARPEICCGKYSRTRRRGVFQCDVMLSVARSARLSVQSLPGAVPALSALHYCLAHDAMLSEQLRQPAFAFPPQLQPADARVRWSCCPFVAQSCLLTRGLASKSAQPTGRGSPPGLSWAVPPTLSTTFPAVSLGEQGPVVTAKPLHGGRAASKQFRGAGGEVLPVVKDQGLRRSSGSM
jgi:hypothetical protein